jgi:hypothetical protein
MKFKKEKEKNEARIGQRAYIKSGIARFLDPASQQAVGLIKIHQTPIGYKPVSLDKYQNAKRTKL